jgi:hypothetical protein
MKILGMSYAIDKSTQNSIEETFRIDIYLLLAYRYIFDTFVIYKEKYSRLNI